MTSIPRPEHPRPNFKREPWHNLNGPWRFAFDPRLVGEQLNWYQPSQPKDLTITVPYPWESSLSGLAASDYKGAGWYEREITMPEDWQGLQPYLNFGAVDWQARVWINGRLVGEHENGYTPFALDLSKDLQPGETATLTVRAYDIAEATTLVGKQVPRWYTHSSGIWQTVWLEGRPASHITNLRLETNVAQAKVSVTVSLHIAESGSFTLNLVSPDGSFSTLEQQQFLAAGDQDLNLTLAVPDRQLWSPESPHLYDLKVELAAIDSSRAADQVSSYFGMREIGRGAWQGKNYEYILLNGEPIYLRGALDQAFHPDGLHTYPSDEVIRGDIQLAKDLGLNMLRCHIKINEPRYYYWADQLGLLIMYDIPSPDLDTPSMRQMFEAAIPEAFARDFNHPSIFAWVLFNETWGLSNHDTLDGQRWVQSVYQQAKQLDPTRLVEDNSVCRYDHVETDINSWHYYNNDYGWVKTHIQRVVDETYPGSSFNYVGGEYVQESAPLMNSEYGGISAAMGDQDIAWCFKYQTTELRRQAKICGYVYTELDDIEWEHNGFVNYDRSRKEFGYAFFVPDMSVADLNSADLVGFDAPPCQTVLPGREMSLPVFVSHWGPKLGQGQVHWQLDFIDRFGERRTVQDGTWPLQMAQFDVLELDPLEVSMPQENGLATLALWLEDEAGGIRCRNYINVEVRGEANAAIEQISTGYALHIDPSNISQTTWSWPPPLVSPNIDKFSALGSGSVDYEIALPHDLALNDIRRLRLRFEASARVGLAKIDWPQQRRGFNYPQTEERKTPSDITVSINETIIGTTSLPDDPADARGILSHHYAVDQGAYGYLTEFVVEGDVLETLHQTLTSQTPLRLRFAVPAEAKHRGGLALYGQTLGSYPMGLILFVETE